MFTRSRSGENAELGSILTNILLTKIRKARFVIRYYVALTCDLQLLAYDTQVLPRDEAKNNIFPLQIFRIPVANVFFFLGESIISNRLVCSSEKVVLMFSLKTERKSKKHSREDHFLRNVVYKRKVLEPNRLLPSDYRDWRFTRP